MTTSWAFSPLALLPLSVNLLIHWQQILHQVSLQHLLSPSHLLASLPMKSVLMSQFYTLVLTLSLRHLPNLCGGFCFVKSFTIPERIPTISFSVIISYSSDTPMPRWEAPLIQAPHLSSAPSLLKISPNQEEDLCSQPLFSIFFRQAGLEFTYVTKDVCPPVSSTFLMLGLLTTPLPFTGSLLLSLSLKAAMEMFISWLTPFLYNYNSINSCFSG